MQLKTLRTIVAVTACWALGSATVAQATIIIYTPVGAVDPDPAAFAPADAINGNGLAFPVPSLINSLAELPKHNENPDSSSGGGMWESWNVPAESITFDLGSVKTFNALLIWNYAEVANNASLDLRTRGAKTLALYADNSATPTTFIQNLTFAKANTLPLTGTYAGTFNWTISYNTPVDLYTLASPLTARYIKFDISSNQDHSNLVGLSEVRFAEVIPEPSSVLLLAAGGLLLFRRSSRKDV